MKKAIGAYLRCLRNEANLTQDDLIEIVSKRLGRTLDPSTISRIENGKNWASGDLLTVLVEVLEANFDDIRALFREGATEGDGIAQAEKWIATRAELKQRLDALSDDQLGTILEILRRFRDDPVKMARLQGFLQGMDD